MANQLNVEQIARICHEANRLYSESADLPPHLPWGHAPDWQRASAIKGVEAIMADPWMGPADSHASWYVEKVNTGWVYGPVKDETAKTHPCMVPYAELPEAQRVKDTLFVNIVRALMPGDVWDKQAREGFDPAAEIVVSDPAQQQLDFNSEGVRNGEVAERQPAGVAAQTDRDGGQAPGLEGSGAPETDKVIGVTGLMANVDSQQTGDANRTDLGQASGVAGSPDYSQGQKQS